ncbi:MAG: EamA family transporter [Cytophagaceae bacterium]|nr:EamA family transporter [Cytophagaceae bacterium]
MKNSLSLRIWLGLLFLYIAWGSTYLGVRFLVEEVPPLLAAGLRNFMAGIILFSLAYFQTSTHPVRLTRRDWAISGLAGILMLTLGNGAVTIAVGWVPSGYASLFSALVPVWLVLIQLRDGVRPTGGILIGLLLGLLGVGLLLNLNHLALTGAEEYFGWGVFALLLGTMGWSMGVMVAKKGALTHSTALIAGMQMLVGGGLLLVLSGFLGEWQQFHPTELSSKPVWSFVYLLIVGSLIAFTVFGWLSKVAPPTLVATYTYVNPLVAILLGWAFAGESLNPQMLLAAGVIVAAVVLITYGQAKARRPAQVEVKEKS